MYVYVYSIQRWEFKVHPSLGHQDHLINASEKENIDVIHSSRFSYLQWDGGYPIRLR